MSEIQEALEIGLDLAHAAEAQAKELYGDYPPDGLGRRWLAAQRDVELIQRALAETVAEATRKRSDLG